MRKSQSFTNEERRLADIARKVAMNQNVLYHGTRYPQSILRAGVLFTPYPGEPKISFTRSPEVAAYFAVMKRFNDEGRGAILVFDRDSLHSRHRMELARSDTGWGYEAEEEIWENITDLSKHLVGLVSELKTFCSLRHRLRSRLFGMHTDNRLRELRLPVPSWCRRPAEMEETSRKQMRATKALNACLDIETVAEQVGLRPDTVRRLARDLRHPDREWNLGGILLSWGLMDRRKLHQKTRHQLVPLRIKLSNGMSAIPVGADRIEALMMYPGKSQGAVMKTLRQELPDLINALVAANDYRRHE